jgi:hypothetical protein
MEPVALRHRGAKGFQIVHRCTGCGAASVNKVAIGTQQPDAVDAVARLSGREPERR